MGLRPSQRDEDAVDRWNALNGVECVFNRAVERRSRPRPESYRGILYAMKYKALREELIESG